VIWQATKACGNTPGTVIGQAVSGSSLRWLAYRLTDPDSWLCVRRASEEMLNANFTRTVWRVTYLQLACSDFAPIFALAAADITRFFLPVVLPLVRKALVRLPAATLRKNFIAARTVSNWLSSLLRLLLPLRFFLPVIASVYR